MGLDMYLSARRYTSEFSDKEANGKLSSIADDLLPPDGNFGAIVISRDVAYWRKANQIHAWFVAKVQDGKDDCGTYDVAREQLEELRDTCLKVLGGISLVDGTVNNGWTYTNGVREAIKEPGKVIANPELAKQLLPPQEGFFFGSTDYDQWYAEDLKSTVEQIDKVLAWVDADLLASGGKYSHIDFQYHSSW